jgi:cytochrome P450
MAPSRVQGLVELGRFGADPLGRLAALARSSPPGLVPFRIGTVPGFLVTDPGAIQEVLEGDDPALLGRGRFVATKRWFEGGVFFTTGAEYDRQVDELGRPSWFDPRTPEIARRQAERTADRLRPDVAFEAFDTFRELTFAVDWEALTGRPDDPESLRRLVAVNRWLPRLIGPFGTVLWRLPNDGRRAVAELDATLDSLIADCRASPDDERVFGVAQLVRKADADGVTSDADIRATVKSQYADPLHAWAFWTFYALGCDPALERRWHEEIDGVVGNRAVTPADVERLPLTRQILLESARLYPPVQAIFREVTADVRVGDVTVRKGETLVLSQWVTHRDARFWDEPLRFDIERWPEEAAAPMPPAYFPFSGGRLGCHGRAASIPQIVAILVTIGRRWRLRPANDRPPRFWPGWALEPKGGLRMIPEPR